MVKKVLGHTAHWVGAAIATVGGLACLPGIALVSLGCLLSDVTIRWRDGL